MFKDRLPLCDGTQMKSSRDVDREDVDHHKYRAPDAAVVVAIHHLVLLLVNV